MSLLRHRIRLVAWNAACVISGCLQLAGGQAPMVPLIAGGG